MAGRGEGLHPTKSGEGTQPHTRPDVPTYDPMRNTWRQTTGEQSSTAGRSGEQSSDRIKAAEQRLKGLDDRALQAGREQSEQWLNNNSFLAGTDKYRQQKKALELTKQEQERRAALAEQGGPQSVDDILREVEALGNQKPGVRDQGSGYGSGGGIFREYWSR
jgi:hypothetical protein